MHAPVGSVGVRKVPLLQGQPPEIVMHHGTGFVQHADQKIGQRLLRLTLRLRLSKLLRLRLRLGLNMWLRLRLGVLLWLMGRLGLWLGRLRPLIG